MARKKKPTNKRKPATKKSPKKRVNAGRQQKLPGTSDPKIKALDKLAADLAEAHTEQNSWKNKATKLRGAMFDAMKKHDRKIYESHGVRFVIKTGQEKLEISIVHADDEIPVAAE